MGDGLTNRGPVPAKCKLEGLHERNEYIHFTTLVSHGRLNHRSKISSAFFIVVDRKIQGCQIKSKSNRILLSNQMFLQRSNWIKRRSNRMTFSIFDTIRFNLEENVSKKSLNCDGKKMIISKDGMSNEIFQYFCHPGGQSLWNGPIYWWPIKFNHCWGGFVLNRIYIESKGFCNISIEDRIESKPIRFDSPGV
jgi:hypothetical protein